jgi:hypothetical protein
LEIEMKRLAVVLALCATMMGCGRHETVVYQQPVQPVAMVAQPVMVQNPDPMTGVIAGMVIGAYMSNGMRYDGHNGYYDSHYRGPSRTITRVTNVTNVTNVVNKTSATTPASPVVATPVKAAPVVAAAPVATPAKVKNPGDAAADHARAMDARKAAVTAQREQRMASKPSGFNSMSKSASSGSSRRK